MTDLGRIRKGKAGAGRATTERPNTEPAPHSDDDFMTRLQLALDMTPKQLAYALSTPLREVIDRTGSRSVMSSGAVDPFWPRLSAYVNTRLAGLLTVKEELDRKLRLDRRRWNERQAEIKNR